jgi:hypothetical protein
MSELHEANGTNGHAKVLPELPVFTVPELTRRGVKSPAKRKYTESKRLPFPLHALPPVLAEYAREAAIAAGDCDPSMIAGPMLSTLGAAIGRSFKAAPTEDYNVCSAIWTVVACRRGSAKSAALDFATEPMHNIHSRLMERTTRRQARYELELAAAKARGDKKDQLPKPPKLRQAVVQDATPESVLEIAYDNLKPPLATRDELAALLMFGRYGAGSSAEAERCQWLESWGGRDLTVNRKISGRRVMYIPKFTVSITGTTQTETLLELMANKGNKRSGLRDRLQIIFADRRLQVISRRRIPEDLVTGYRQVVEYLYRLPTDLRAGPKKVYYSEEAEREFDDWHNAHARQQHITIDDDVSDLMAKTRSYMSRFSLAVHCAACAYERANPERPMARATVQSGIAIAEWFEEEMKRFYGTAEQADSEQRQWDKIVSIVRSQEGGAIELRSFLANQRSLHAGRNRRMTRDEFREFIGPVLEAGALRIELRGRVEWLVAPDPSEWPADADGDVDEGADEGGGEPAAMIDPARALAELWLSLTTKRRPDGTPVETLQQVTPAIANLLKNVRLSEDAIDAAMRLAGRNTSEWFSDFENRMTPPKQGAQGDNQQRAFERFGPS